MPESLLFRGTVFLVFAVFLSACGESAEPELVGLAILPADSFVDGPTSGQFIKPDNGRAPPFIRQQPVQGFSALLAQDDGSFLALPDNGFGSRENSPDYVLRVFRITPDFRSVSGGSGTIEASPEFELRDPNGHIKWSIVADLAFYPESVIRVDTAITLHRLLTGADFDVESFRQVPDGTFYFGDEFGPFLLHADAEGRLLEPPISLPGVYSPQHPELGDRTPNLPRSAGFEGMALSADGMSLYPMLEQPLAGDEGVVRIYEFDLRSNSYTHSSPDESAFLYSLSPEAHYATEFVWSHGATYLVIERDPGQGPTAEFKKVFSVDLGLPAEDGALAKTQVLDLMSVADPHDLGETGTGRFTFPYETTEALAVLEDGTIAIVNDNNYPFGKGRFWENGEPDPNELIVVRP